MQQLHITNSHFITYKDELLTVDVLGGVDLSQVERMVCTLRITYQNYPPQRSTLDLYNDTQVNKLIRTICDNWELKLTEVSGSIHNLILQLEEYRLQQLKYGGKQSHHTFEPNEADKQKATTFLKHKNLLAELIKQLNITGILGEDENAVILFLALASYKFSNPFSVLCLAKSGIGKSYILQKLSECMPHGTYSFHSQISANALYYFNSYELQNKALLIEDLEWTTQMLQPLATLQSQGKLVKTRATKDKDGMLHSTTFEVVANLCLVACAYSDKNFEEISLPFLCLHLNHTHNQDILVMEYQKKCKAGQIKTDDIKQAQHLLKCAMAMLQNMSVINPFATLIHLPDEVAHPRKSLLLLLNFIDVITYFFQYQREQIVDESTGEVCIKTHPQDIELAFKYLKNNLFRRADELSTSARGFFVWLNAFLNEAQQTQFTAMDIRKAKAIHPRTLNRYLQELKLFSYIQIAGGNKNREGFIYKLTNFGNQTDTQNKIEQALQSTLKNVWAEYNKLNTKAQSKPIEAKPEPIKTEPEKLVISEAQPIKTAQQNTSLEAEPKAEQQPTFFEPHYKRIRINEKEEYTLKILLELEAKEQGRQYLASDITTLSKRSQCIEARYLKTLWEQGKLNREWKNRQYYYTIATTNSKPVSQNPQTNPEPQAQ
jgi:hypothetical protein